ncbi:hypothetical protein ABE438_11590 [Bosea sp. TWI1241]|uniref:hypothetical protein n=1 Tax=Bosea sp. TWI1241 TaxID=3148904 RepID=UPI003208E54F
MRFLLRMLGFLAVAAGFVVLLTDGAAAIANSTLHATPLAETLAAVFGERMAGFRAAVIRDVHPLLWDPVLVTVLRLPTALAGLLLGFLLLRLGRRPDPVIGIVTRR